MKRPQKLSSFFRTHKWCRNDYAIDRKGQTVLPTARTAYAFCIYGAALRLGAAGHITLEDLDRTWDINDIMTWNDYTARDRADVIKELKRRGL